MSNLAEAWAWKQDIPLTTKGVLLALADHSDDEGICWPGVKGLAQKCRISQVTIRYHIRVLRNMGLISAEKRVRTDGTQTSNLYHLHVNILTPTLKVVDRYPQADEGETLKVVDTHEPSLEPSEELVSEKETSKKENLGPPESGKEMLWRFTADEYRDMAVKYKGVDLVHEAQRCMAWWAERSGPQTKNPKWKSRFYNWMNNVKNGARNGRPVGFENDVRKFADFEARRAGADPDRGSVPDVREPTS